MTRPPPAHPFLIRRLLATAGVAGDLLLLALGTPAIASGGQAAASTATAAPPILPGVWRMAGTDPDLPSSDLEPLRGIVGPATVVGLGESVHTSGGYYEAKHRVFRYLVEKLGFRAIAFETPWLGAEAANDYVQSCAGDPDTASAGFFPVWRSAEVSALLGWMCDWNRAHHRAKDRLENEFARSERAPVQAAAACEAAVQAVAAARRRCSSTCASPAPASRCSRRAPSTRSPARRWCRDGRTTRCSSSTTRGRCSRSTGRRAAESWRAPARRKRGVSDAQRKPRRSSRLKVSKASSP